MEAASGKPGLSRKLLFCLPAGILGIALLGVLPVVPCPDCEGSGAQVVLLSSLGPSNCRRCGGQGRMSVAHRISTKPEQTLIGAAEEADLFHIFPRLAKENIPCCPGSKMLGIVEFATDSPQNARRAREIVERDAAERAYKFWSPGKPNPWAAK